MCPGPCLCFALTSLLLSPGYRRYLLVLMKPWIQATWLSARVTVSAFSHLFCHSCFRETPGWVMLSRWIYCCMFDVHVCVYVYEGLLLRVWICMCSCGCVSLLPWAPVRRPNRINGLVWVHFLTEPDLSRRLLILSTSSIDCGSLGNPGYTMESTNDIDNTITVMFHFEVFTSQAMKVGLGISIWI